MVEEHPLNELTEEERGTLRAARIMEDFKESAAYSVWRSAAESQREAWRQRALLQAREVGDVLECEYAKGAVYAFDLILGTPDHIIETAAQIRRDLGIGENEE